MKISSSICSGEVLPGHELEIRDAEGTVLAERQVGRIMFRGPSVMTEYFGRSEETARVLSTDGWLDTGDLGYLVGGSLVVAGRSKDLILVNGRNVWPEDLELAVENHIDLLAECAGRISHQLYSPPVQLLSAKSGVRSGGARLPAQLHE